MRARTRWVVVSAAWVAASVVLLTALAHFGPPGGSNFQPGLATAYEDLNTTRPGGHIIFGSPLPQAEIFPGPNTSVAATLGLIHLLEIAPNSSDPEHPAVLAEAAPQTLTQFNSTTSTHGTPYLKLIATLPVYPVNASLWTNGTNLPPASGYAQQSILEVNYTVTSGSDGSPGVLVSWTVSGWPWVDAPADELALEYTVQVVAGTGFVTCSGPPSTNAPDASCTPEPLAQGQAVWSSALTALKGFGPDESVAWVSWGPQVGGSNAIAESVSAGAFYEEPGVSALVIAAPGGGASSLMGSMLFLLSPGEFGGLTGPLVGNVPVYGGAVALFTGAAVVGVLLSRRRDQAIGRDLAS